MKRKALFVGIDNYTRGIPALSCARNDANALLEYFLKHGYAEDDVSILRDGRTSEILDELDEQTKRLKPGDLFLFFFAGHGYTIEKSDGSFDRCLAGADDRRDRILMGKEGISLSEIKDRADKARCPFVVILDACQTKIDTSRAADISRKDVCNQRDLLAISSVVNRKGRSGQSIPFVVINSCDVGEVAYELEEIEQGLFTFSMLETLKQMDNPVFDERLLALISSRMGEHGSGYSQHPKLMRADASDIFDIHIFPAADSFHETLVVCPVCGKKNRPEDTFKCRECGRDNLCIRHQDEKTFLCINCAEKMARNAVEEAEQRHAEAPGQPLKTEPRHGGKEFSVTMRKKTVRYMLTAFRDGFQCAMGGRVMAKHILPAVEAAYDAGVRWFEIGGGAIFQTSFFYCQQNAFDVMDSFRAACPGAELQTLSRGPNIVGLESQPEDVIRLHAKLFCKHGVSAIRNYDALYDPDNLKIPGQHIRQAGMIHEVALGIMGIPPKLDIGYAHTPEFYAERMRSFLDSGMPIDRVCIKDNSGTTSPDVVFNTIRQIRRLLGEKMHIQFHTHDSIGMGRECCLAALKGGADGLDLSFAPLSGGSCQPDLIAMYQSLQGSPEFQFDIDAAKMGHAAREFKEAIKPYYIRPEALAMNKNLIDIPVAEGVLSANMQMLVDNGVDCPYEKMVPEFAESFKRGGCAAASMTPVAQFYVQQAAWNVVYGRFSRFVPGYAKLLLGYFGKLPVAPDPVLVDAASSFLADNPATSAYARQAQRSVIELNNADPNKGGAYACRRLKESGIPITDENVFIVATCKDKGLQFLKGFRPMGCRFVDLRRKDE